MLVYFMGKGGSQIPMLQDSDKGEGGIKKGQKKSDVFYGRPLMIKHHILDLEWTN